MAASDQRAERLKAQLRANLRRRKAPGGAVEAPGEGDQRRTAIDPSADDAAD
jgi:hypothetical protein